VVPNELRQDIPVLAFGPFRLHRNPRMLCVGTESVRLGGRAIDLLIALAERAGEVVSRAELERQVWPYSMVEESSLRVHIASLRRALGDGIGDARYIANIPGRGYSFVAAVDALYPDLRAHDAPPERALPCQLPLRMNTIIGRDSVVEALGRDLAAGRRLVTIIGHGGMGKTAVALTVAHKLKAEYEGGACFLDLAPMQEPGLVPNALAGALGITVFGDSVMQTVDLWLQHRHMLIVVDNCEHLLDSATELINRILDAAPHIDIIATSREALEADGERIHRLQPLGTPEHDCVLDCEAALAYPALRLLVNRAMASVDAFQLTQANLGAAISLCRRLDGVPLAIEFAAARVGLLGVQGVVEQLDDRLRLLGTGRRTALPRHRTLRALLDWSYDLLSEPDRRIFLRCGIFNGPFSLESAVAVLTDEAIGAQEVQTRLLGLIGKSLIVSDHGGPEVMLSLLEITRAYAISLLSADDAYPVVADKHARHMVELMRKCEADWAVMPRAAWLKRYLHTMRNVRAALDWAFGPGGNRDLGVRLSGAMMLQMARIFSEDELRTYARKALAAIAEGATVDAVHEMRLNIILSDVTAQGAGNPPDSPDSLHPSVVKALANAERDGEPLGQLEALFHIAMTCFGGGNYQQMQAIADRILSVSSACQHDAGSVLGTRIKAQATHFLGDHAGAETLALRALSYPGVVFPLALSSPVDRNVSMQIILSRALWLRGDGARARQAAADCVALAALDVTPISLGHALGLAALPVALWRGDNVLARQLVERLAAHAERHAMTYWLGWSQHLRRVLAMREGGPAPLQQAASTADSLQLDHLATFSPALALPTVFGRCADGKVQWCAPEVLRIQGERQFDQYSEGEQCAERFLLESLALARRQGALAWVLRSTSSLARLRCLQGRPADAVAMLEPVIAELPGDAGSADLHAALEILDLAR
jgi:predicted ATPase/DNA-binding winged helix-turn-helix (wHTH) protein